MVYFWHTLGMKFNIQPKLIFKKSTGISIYKYISEEIKNMMEKQPHIDTMVLAPERELSKIFKVSRVTIRRALNELKKQDILIPRKKIGNIVHTNKKLICLSIMRCSFYNHPNIILDSAKNYLEMKGYKIIESANYSLEQQLKILDMYKENVGGFIIYPMIDFDNRFVDAVKNIVFDVPVVLVNIYIEGTGADFVGADEKKGSMEATEFLIKKGCRNIVYLSCFEKIWTNINREQGYMETMNKYNLKPEIARKEVIGYNYIEVGYLWAKELIKNNKNIEAIMCMNDMASIGVFNALKENGIKIGEDICIFGFGDDIEMHAYFNFGQCPISSVVVPRDDMGRVAGELLLNKIEGRISREEVQFVKLKTSLALRGSTKCAELTLS